MASEFRRIAAAASLSAVALTGCGGAASDDPSAASDSGSGAAPQTLTVFAAASLTEVYGQLEKDFEASHPNVDVVLTTAGSSDLVTQIEQGAPADVLATADEKNMDRARDGGLITGDPKLFATNELTIAVQPGNPDGITSLASLESPDVKVVRCAVPVPCGSVSDQVLSDAKVKLTPVSEEQSVTDVLGKVTSGEADAGLVYVTDVTRSKGGAEAVEIPQAAAHRTNYPIAEVESAKNAQLAQEFIALVLSPQGQKVLKDAGFGAP